MEMHTFSGVLIIFFLFGKTDCFVHYCYAMLKLHLKITLTNSCSFVLVLYSLSFVNNKNTSKTSLDHLFCCCNLFNSCEEKTDRNHHKPLTEPVWYMLYIEYDNVQDKFGLLSFSTFWKRHQNDMKTHL